MAKTFAIIGSGFCGKIAFARLIDVLDKTDKILVFDIEKENFPGTAFFNFSSHYILNIPAKKMSAFIDDEQSFCNFLAKNYPKTWQEIGEFGFAPRYIYGKYVEEIFAKAKKTAQNKGLEYELINDEVIAVENNLGRFDVTAKNGTKYDVTEVILATSFRQSKLPLKIEAENVVQALWNEDAIKFHNKKFTNEKICLIGTGLTTIDVIVGLKKKGFSGKVVVISRRGNLPKRHVDQLTPKIDVIDVMDAKKGVLFLCLKIRHFLKENPQFDLRHVINSIRLITVDLWHNFDEKNKKLFIRLMPYFNIFRHRAPNISMDIIDEMLATKQLEVKKGGIKSYEKLGNKIIVKTKFEELEVDYLVNCLGFEFNAEKYPLLSQMITENLLTKDLMMVRSNNSKIYLVGGLNIGKDLECTSVPDLKVSVEEAVKKIC
ncbi:MAG: FAD/NAD(P)-binding protein [Rickettsiales bacterium]|nr:FAD/NAD(P)-binding protein [Rickettsiales bacterium]